MIKSHRAVAAAKSTKLVKRKKKALRKKKIGRMRRGRSGKLKTSPFFIRSHPRKQTSTEMADHINWPHNG